MKMNSKMTAAGTLLAGFEESAQSHGRTPVSIGGTLTVGTPGANPP
jgi:hypothetical protein